jgi:hypothetical protein
MRRWGGRFQSLSQTLVNLSVAAIDGGRGAMKCGKATTVSGTQTIRLIFDKPQRLTRISLVFEETETERTQEFVLRWSSVGDSGHSFREIVRQQWNFSPRNTVREVEEYQVGLSDVTVLELVIVPDISRGSAHASLTSLRVS